MNMKNILLIGIVLAIFAGSVCAVSAAPFNCQNYDRHADIVMNVTVDNETVDNVTVPENESAPAPITPTGELVGPHISTRAVDVYDPMTHIQTHDGEIWNIEPANYFIWPALKMVHTIFSWF